MSQIPDREETMIRVRFQMTQAELFARYHIAMAETGVSCLREIKNGHGTPLTDTEKKKSNLSSALVHIHRIEGLGELLIALEMDNYPKYQECLKRASLGE